MEIFTNHKNYIIKRINTVVRVAVYNLFPLKLALFIVLLYELLDFSILPLQKTTTFQLNLDTFFIGDSSDAVVPIIFKFYKSNRIYISPFSREVVAFSDLFGVTSTLASELESVLGMNIPVHLFTDI